MSANVEIVRELYRAFKEKDYDAFALICDESISWNQNPGFPNGHRYVGAQAVIDNVFKSFDDNWHEWVFKIDELHDAGDVIIVTGQYEGRHVKTGKAFVSEAAHHYRIHSGRVVAFQQYCDTKVIWDAMTR